MKGNPVGYGFGTYRYESARPAWLTTETQLTHNAYFQIGVEAGFLGLLFFLAFLALWLYEMVRGCYLPLRPVSFLRMSGVMAGFYLLLEILSRFAHVEIFPTNSFRIVALGGVGLVMVLRRGLPQDGKPRQQAKHPPRLHHRRGDLPAWPTTCLRATSTASALASPLSSLMGLGLIQATDGIAPEFIPPLPRGCGSDRKCRRRLAAPSRSGFVEMLRARGRFERDTGLSIRASSPSESQDNLDQAGKLADLAVSLAPFDGENWRLKGNCRPGVV